MQVKLLWKFPYKKKLREVNKRPVSGWEKAIIATLVAVTAAIVAVVVIAITRPDTDAGQKFSYVIEAGTKELLDAGETPPNQPPTDLSLKVGDTLEVINNDVAVHSYSFITVRPGETGSYVFKTPGTYVGVCTIGSHTSVTITVT